MTAAACVVMGLLNGCNDKEPSAPASAPVPTPKQGQSEQTQPVEPAKPAQVIDTSVPLNQYQDLAQNNGQPLTYLVLAKAPGATTEDKMGYLSPTTWPPTTRSSARTSKRHSGLPSRHR